MDKILRRTPLNFGLGQGMMEYWKVVFKGVIV
jgi:hypothetical protein